VLEHVVASDTEIAIANLDQHMTIAEVISRPREVVGCAAFDMQQLLGPRKDLHHAAIIRRKKITASQDFPAWKLDAHVLTSRKSRTQTAFLPQLERELERCVRLCSLRAFELRSDRYHQKRK
jgi:hypothetical protein